ncbi:MAG: DUF4097 family beta strand repeat-containing protein [Clostridia bacterium]
MERNLSFETEKLSEIAVHLAWAQLEIFADDVEKIQVMAAGDENTTNDLRIEVKDNVLLVEQPQYGISFNITDSKWLQVCVRVPRTWKKLIRCNTISGLLSARKLSGSEIALDTVSGDVQALKLTSPQMFVRTVSGDVRGEELTAERLNVRSVSGNMALDALSVGSLHGGSISGEQIYNMLGSFERVDVTAVSGNVMITSPVDEMSVSLRSISGRVRTEGVTITERAGLPSVRVTGVSADLKLIGIKE